MLRRQAWIVLIAAYILFPAAWLMPADWTNTSPAFVLTWWFLFLLRTFELHYGIALVVIGGVALIVKRWRLAVPALLLGLVLMRPVWQAAWPNADADITSPNSAGLKVMSVNLLMINQQIDPMLAEIEAADPDVILLQEYAYQWHRAMQKRMLERWPHYIGVPQDDSFGIAIYSRLPLENATAQLPLGEGFIPQIKATVQLGDKPIDLYNIHLLPPRTLWYTTEHRLEFADLLKHLHQQQGAYVIAGDFNFTTTSPQAAALHERGLKDVHDIAGSGLGLTWPVNGVVRYMPVPGIRFDHVYLSEELTAPEAAMGVGPGSDHRPIITTIRWR